MDIMIIQIVHGTGFAEVENYSSSSNFNALALAIGRMIDNVEHLASIRATVYPFVSREYRKNCISFHQVNDLPAEHTEIWVGGGLY